MLLRRVRDDAQLVVAPSIARRLVPRATTTRPRTLLADTRRVKRVLLRCGVEQELVDDGAGLKLVAPSGYETDGSIVQLIDGLVRGKVLAWVADADDGTFGLGDPDSARAVASSSLRRRQCARDDPLRLRRRGRRLWDRRRRPDVFVAPSALHELAKRIYVCHASLRVDPSRVESVKFTQAGKPVVARDAAALRDAVGSLYADRAVSLGAAGVGPVDVEIAIALAEGGPPRRVVCSAEAKTSTGSWRRCATPDVRAVFEVRPALVNAFLATSRVPDASASDAR